MNAPTTSSGSSLAPGTAPMHPLFHDLFIAAPAPDDGTARPSRRRQVLTRTVRHATPVSPR